MTEKKMTKRDYFTILRETYPKTAENYVEVIAFLDHELELLDKKKKSTTEKVDAYKLVKDLLNERMKLEKQYSLAELLEIIPECADYTTQRISYVMSSMVKDENYKIKKATNSQKRVVYIRFA